MKSVRALLLSLASIAILAGCEAAPALPLSAKARVAVTKAAPVAEARKDETIEPLRGMVGEFNEAVPVVAPNVGAEIAEANPATAKPATRTVQWWIRYFRNGGHDSRCMCSYST